MTLDPTGIEARVRAATALQREGRLDEAAALYRAVLDEAPRIRVAVNNLAALLRAQDRWVEEEAVLRAALAASPHDPAIRYSLSLILLASGDYREGWPLYESRTEVPENRIAKPAPSFPKWTGGAVTSLLLYPEQGLGDHIMFARYVPDLVARGVRVTMLCPPPLCRLLQPLGAEVIAAQGTVEIPPKDGWAMMASLPGLMGTLPDAPYLSNANPAGVGSGIGVMVRGSPVHRNDASRSLPADLAAELLTLGRDLSPEATGAQDFQDTADIIAGLALVITVDTSVAHLAGAMGKPVWILLPARQVDWRWRREGEGSAWYPSARLFRQPAPGEWRPALDQVRAALQMPS